MKTVRRVAPPLETGEEARMPTGIPTLDEMLEGGFPQGSLITLAGRPGTGKTIFGSLFLYNGGQMFRQPGMYVSMLESRKAYLRNMSRLGLNFEPLERNGTFLFLEMPTLTAEGLPAIWEEIVKNVQEHNIERLVIDSFTAMAPAFQSPGELRVFLHMLLGKIIGGSGCTTLMITETIPGNAYAGTGVEEFIADGVVQFHLLPVAGDARVRYLEIMKMRGTKHQMGPIPMEIGDGGIAIRHPHIRGPASQL